MFSQKVAIQSIQIPNIISKYLCFLLYCENNNLIKLACPFYGKGTFFHHLVVTLYHNISTFRIGVCLYSVYGKTFGLVVETLAELHSWVLEMSPFSAIVYIFWNRGQGDMSFRR